MVIAGTLCAWLLLGSGNYAAPTTYSIHNGDTFTTIAQKHGVSVAALMGANPGLSESRLKIGATLHVPAHMRVDPFAKLHKPSVPANGYVVRNGDNDWTIARRYGIKPSELRAMNPGVDWTKLQLGSTLTVPTAGTRVAANQTNSTPQPTVARKAAGGHYVVSNGDNDWTIARKYGIKPSELRAMNGGINWTKLQIGTKLAVPGGRTVTHVASLITTSRAKISADGVAIRRGPSTDSGKVTVVQCGLVAKVLDREGSWYKLKFPRGSVGWVRRDLLNPVKASAVASSSHPRQRYVASNSGSRRSRRSGGSHRELVAMNSGSSSSLIGTARQYMGTRYRWGGTSSRGFDCSGFTTTVFRQHGVKLPRRSIDQSRAGCRVSKGNLQKGDLVFFKTNRGTRINHVGVYIGNGKFIHASSGGGRVREDTLNSGYYARRFAGGSRVKVKKD